MAVIKQKKEEKPKFVEKKFKIEQKVWKEAESYMKYAGFSGTPSEKLKDLFEAALDYVIGAEREEFEEFKRKEEETRAKRKLENERLREAREKGTKEVEAALAQAPTTASAGGEGKDSQSNDKSYNKNTNMNQNNKKFNK